jgi:hypothetical protein
VGWPHPQLYLPRPLRLNRITGPTIQVSAAGVTFGDPAGSSLLFDSRTSDYAGESPPGCAGSGRELVRQVPNPAGSASANPSPLAFYCGPSGVNLLEPALRPDGQLIVAGAESDPNKSMDPNLAAGKPRLVTIALSSMAGPSPSQLHFITPSRLAAVDPDFSPYGTRIAFSGPGGIYVVAAGGGRPRKVIARASHPAWSPHSLPAHLRLTLTAPRRQRVLRRQGLLASVRCNLPCAAATAGAVVIEGSSRRYMTRTVVRVLGANRPVAISLALKRAALRAIHDALSHYLRVTATVAAAAKTVTEHRSAWLRFRVRQ